MPYDPNQSNLEGFVNGAPTNGNGAGSPEGFPYASPLTDKGLEADFYDNAFTWEPKYQNRFIMSGADGIPAFLIKASAKPSMTNGTVTLDHINVQRYVKGKTIWNTIQISIYDAIVPSAAQACIEWVRQHHESATGRDGYASMYKRDITLESLSPLGEVIEEWTLKGTYLETVDFGSLDWATEGAVEISATLKYDWAFLNF
jgi:hypothetical protein